MMEIGNAVMFDVLINIHIHKIDIVIMIYIVLTLNNACFKTSFNLDSNHITHTLRKNGLT